MEPRFWALSPAPIYLTVELSNITMVFIAVMSVDCTSLSANFSALNSATFQALNVTLNNEVFCIVEGAADKLFYAAHIFLFFIHRSIAVFREA
jgi:hypothetical protein